jgi:ribonuclease HII
MFLSKFNLKLLKFSVICFKILKEMLELQLYPYLKEAGTDEAGRGCLAGPVVAAAVILPLGYTNELLNDSKKLNESQRDELRLVIEKDALAFAVSFVYQDEIDHINILRASITAMHRALKQLKITPEFILVDGNKFVPFQNIPHKTIVKGDGKFQNIAAASILAKTYRDEYMLKIHELFPQYRWDKNKGYPTEHHRKAIQVHGICEHHRKSFKLLPEQPILDL